MREAILSLRVCCLAIRTHGVAGELDAGEQPEAGGNACLCATICDLSAAKSKHGKPGACHWHGSGIKYLHVPKVQSDSSRAPFRCGRGSRPVCPRFRCHRIVRGGLSLAPPRCNFPHGTLRGLLVCQRPGGSGGCAVGCLPARDFSRHRGHPDCQFASAESFIPASSGACAARSLRRFLSSPVDCSTGVVFLWWS